MEIGLGIFDGCDFQSQVKYFKKFGVKRTFVVSEIPQFDAVMKLFQENEIVCETLHAPYHGINAMWEEDEEAAETMLNRLKDSVDKCAKYRIPVTVIHVSSGNPMPDISACGIKRYEELFRYAEEKGVKVALENLRYLENLSYFMNKHDSLGFCWDDGHENCFTEGIRFMEIFGKRLVAMHIHDNRCGKNTDDHLLPFDGNIDFETVAKDIAASGYEGTLMLEIGKLASLDGKKIYEDFSDEAYIQRAVEAAKKVADMVENHRKSL